MSSQINNQVDLPIFKHDFQAAALQHDSTIGIGTRLYGDVCLRGYLYPVAKKIHERVDLSILDEQRLSGLPEEFLEIHYFGDLTNDKQALSLNGLNKLYNTGYLDSIIQTTNPKRYVVRQNIIKNVLGNW